VRYLDRIEHIMSMASEKRAPQRQVHVLLTLHNGERSFGMSLAQRSSAIGPKYTVVSSVFANSPADRAGVRTGEFDHRAGHSPVLTVQLTDQTWRIWCIALAAGYVVRSINDKPTNGLTVAQVASHFRNASQVRGGEAIRA
jgi:S1-C subfamily serine protease